jgi:hypothetical protein
LPAPRVVGKYIVGAARRRQVFHVARFDQPNGRKIKGGSSDARSASPNTVPP